MTLIFFFLTGAFDLLATINKDVFLGLYLLFNKKLLPYPTVTWGSTLVCLLPTRSKCYFVHFKHTKLVDSLEVTANKCLFDDRNRIAIILHSN
jgi:hypothetical protein